VNPSECSAIRAPHRKKDSALWRRARGAAGRSGTVALAAAEEKIKKIRNKIERKEKIPDNELATVRKQRKK